MRRFSAQASAERMARVVTALLRADRPNGGWVKGSDLAIECEVSRATAYRWLNRLEEAGWPLERDVDNCNAMRDCLGVRSLLIAQRRDVDRSAHLRRVA